MKRLGVCVTFLACGLFLFAAAAANVTAQMKAPPGDEYKKVSSLVQLPNFLPGLGTLYVKPDTLPAGPFLAYDR
jgi:hypothetical protein